MLGVMGGSPCGVIIGIDMPIMGWCKGLIGCPGMCGDMDMYCGESVCGGGTGNAVTGGGGGSAMGPGCAG